MNTTRLPSSPSGIPLLATLVLLHVLLLWAWHSTRHASLGQPADTSAMSWVWISPRKAAPTDAPLPPVQPPMPVRKDSRKVPERTTSTRPIPAPAVVADSLPADPPLAPADDPFATPSAPAAAADLADRARRAAGAIDKQLRAESPRGPERLRVQTDYQRFVAGIEGAVAGNPLAPASITEIGSSDRTVRRYKISGLLGTYCLRYDLLKGGQPRIELSCP